MALIDFGKSFSIGSQKLIGYNSCLYVQVRTATKKASTYSARKTRRRPNYLGIKQTEGSTVKPGTPLLTQRFLTHNLGYNVTRDKRFTIFSKEHGVVRYHYDPINDLQYVSVDNNDIPPLYTLSHVKYIVSEKIDVDKYLSFTTPEKIDHVKEKLNEFIEEYKSEHKEFYKTRAFNKRTRACNLIDISLL